MRCPHDKSELVVRDTEGHIGFRCHTCQGAWLPPRYVQSIQYTRMFSYPAFVHELAAGPASPTNLPCPAGCGTLVMTAALEVPVLWCRSCQGAWFEPGTVRALLARMPPVESGLPSGGTAAAQVGGEIALWTILLGLLS